MTMKSRIFFFTCGIMIAILAIEGSVRAVSPLLGPPLVKWNTMEDAKTLKLEEFRTRYRSPKYVFMGNSTALIGFNPSVFDNEAGLAPGSSFNAAMNGSEIQQIRDFACGYILKETRPGNLVILFSYSGMAVNDEYSGSLGDVSPFEKNLYIYRYRNTFRDPMTLNTFLRILKYRDKRQGIVYRWADSLNEFGYAKYGTSRSEISDPGWNPSQATKKNGVPSTILNEKGLEYLVEIRDLAKAQGGNLIIGTVPTLSFSLNYRGTVEHIAKYLGIEFVQGNDAVGQGKYFQDGVHLNEQGAAIFSKFLAHALAKIG